MWLMTVSQEIFNGFLERLGAMMMPSVVIVMLTGADRSRGLNSRVNSLFGASFDAIIKSYPPQ
jgi:hypothetical protein